MWIKRLTLNKYLSPDLVTPRHTSVPDTALIGVGLAGREVLSQVAETLSARFGAHWPNNVRLLQIDVLGPGGALPPPRGLSHNQFLALRPEFPKPEQSEKGWWPEWDWYRTTAPDFNRARGRWAIFYDLRKGFQGSDLWAALQQTLDGLAGPYVRIIGTTFDDASSGMLIDLAHFINLAAASPSNPPQIQFWLAGPLGRDWPASVVDRNRLLSRQTQSERTLATLSELERFQRHEFVELNYVPEGHAQSLQLRQTFQRALVETLFLFEPRDSRAAPEGDVFAAMADGMLALLNPEAQNGLVEALKPPLNTRLANEGRGAVHALGSYAVRVPLSALTQTLSARLVREALFEIGVGLLPLERCDPSNGVYQKIEGEADLPVLPGKQVLDEIFALRRDFRQKFSTVAFGQRVCARVGELLNGDWQISGNNLHRRRQGLIQARRWLDQLHKSLITEGAPQIVRTRVKELLDELLKWEAFLREQLYPLCVHALQEAQTELKALQQQTARDWALTETLDWGTYQKTLRTWTEQPAEAEDSALVRLAERFGWDVQYHENSAWQIRFLILPGNFVWEEGSALDAFAVSRTSGRLLENLNQIAATLVRIYGHQLALEVALEKVGHDLKPATWSEKSRPRLKYTDLGLVDSVPLSNWLIAPASPEGQKLLNKLQADQTLKQLRLASSLEEDTVTLLRIQPWIPLDQTHLYNEDAWEGKVIPTELYVWPAEQQVARVTHGAFKPGPHLMRCFAIDPELMRLLSLGLLYQVFVQTPAGFFFEPGELVARQLIDPADTLAKALAVIFDAFHPHAFRVNLEGRRKAQQSLEKKREAIKPQRALHFRRIKSELIEPLQKSSDAMQTQLSSYLEALKNQEAGLH